jgi:peptidyl-prolyl cis-trans isomerase C
MRFRWAAAAGGWVVALGLLAAGVWVWKEGRACEPEDRLVAPVVARVDGQEIPGEDLELEVLAAQARSGLRYEGTVGERQLAELRVRLLEGLLDRVLLEREAARRGYRADPAKVEQALQRLRRQVPEGTTLARLVEAGRFREAMRRRATSAVVIEAFLADLRRGWKPTAEEVEAYYRERSEEFREPEAALFRQIVLDDRGRAEEAVRRARAGERFEAVGEALAPDRGPFDRGAIPLRMPRGNPDPREPVLFKMKPGEVKGPVPIPGGLYAVLRLERHIPARVVPFEEARDRIRRMLEGRKQSSGLQELLWKLRAEAKIERLLPASTGPTPTPSPR